MNRGLAGLSDAALRREVSRLRASRVRRPSEDRRLARLLAALGDRLRQRGRYRQAAAVLRQTIALVERTVGPDHSTLSRPLNALAVCYKELARFVDAGPLFQRALRIAERDGARHAEVATIYRNLAGLEHAAGNWRRGEPFARRALAVRLRQLGPRDPEVATDLTTLAALLAPQGKHAEAERLCRRALRLLERVHGPRHHLVAVALNNLAALHQSRGRPSDAESLYRRALEIDRAACGSDHPAVGFELNNLGALIGRERPREALLLFRIALDIFRGALGADHPNVAVCLENSVPILKRLGKREEAAAASRHAARILAKVEAVNDEAVGLTGTINPECARFDLVVKRSPIHRLGVFAGEDIPRGRKVVEFTGERVSMTEAIRRGSPRLAYAFALDACWALDGAIGGSGAEYINHSCEPNLRARIGGGRIWYTSARAIVGGEELSIDYKYAEALNVRCKCGAPSCRGTMSVVRRGAGGSRAPRRGKK